MKKMLIAALIFAMGVVFTAPSFAVESEFGGYWRVRGFMNNDFDGTSTYNAADNDISKFDTRTRLYYTANISDHLKFVNKFEMDATWGDAGSYGDIGADGVNFEIKNSYADYTSGIVNAKIGTQGVVLSRGFLFDDDFSGLNLSVGSTGFVFMKVLEVSDNAGDDTAIYQINHTIAADNFSITPALTYVDLPDSSSAYFFAVDADLTSGNASLWTTLMYEGGEEDATNRDISAYLLALGGNLSVGETLSFHGQIFTASGDSDNTDNDIEGFGSTNNAGAQLPGRSYYWSEIMGYGVFDEQVSTNSPADKISNITAYNIGATVSPTEKLTLNFDIWYAQLNEVAAGVDDSLGTEFDFKATYNLTGGLTLDLVAAYLMAGDGTYNGANEEDPIEVGTRLSLAF